MKDLSLFWFPQFIYHIVVEGLLDFDWRILISRVLLKLVRIVCVPLRLLGRLVETSLNLVSANGGLFKTLYKFLTNPKAIVFIPKGSERYLTVVAHVDPRTSLLCKASTLCDICPDSRAAADLCAMASKLAYENHQVIKSVVEKKWEMHLIGAYNCWNEMQRTNSTQAFMFADRKEDAQVVVLAFRGTEVFNAYDWCTDFDFAWYQLPHLGRVHIGFLEALGLGNRKDKETFNRIRANIYENTRTSNDWSPTSGLADSIRSQKTLAYDHLSHELLSVLSRNKRAKVYITGHSLGGALSTLFAAMLFYYRDACKIFHNRTPAEDDITKRIAAVYTFGQPRVGDDTFAMFMDRHLNQSMVRYFRIVYQSDIVPRVPFDNIIFGFKHNGRCFYFDHLFKLQIRRSKPNPNYFHPVEFTLARVYGMFELFRSFSLAYNYGKEYQDTSLTTMVRFVGVMLPGIACHSPTNYINAVRLGPDHLHLVCSNSNRPPCIGDKD